MKKIFLFGFGLAIILTQSICYGQVTDKQIQVGLDKMYDFKWNDAFDVFNSLIKKNPDDPRGYHYKSMIYLWYYLGNLNEANLDSFVYFSDKSLELADAKAQKKPSPEISYLIGSIYYNKSIAEARSGNYLQALYTSNQMKSNLEDAVKQKPDFYDAYLGLGLYNFALSQIPSTLEWAANLVGITADKELGLDYVRKATQKGKLSKVDAQYYLSQLYSRVIVDNPSAKELLTNLVKRYSKNLLFNFSLAWVEFETNDLNNCEKHLRYVINSDDKLYPFVVSNSHYLLGNVYFAKSQFDSARVHYASYIRSAVTNDYKGFSNYRIGLCYELSGNRKEAVKYYEKSDNGNSDIEEDLYAERKGEELQSNKINLNDIKLIRINNLIKQSKFDSAIDSLENFLQLPKLSNDQKAEAKFHLCESYYKQRQLGKALENAVDCIQTPVDKEKWVHAYAHYFGAWISYYQKNMVDAQLFLEQIDQMDEYDFRNSLENKIYTLQRLLPKKDNK